MKIIFVLVTIKFEISTIPFITNQNWILDIKQIISTNQNVIVISSIAYVHIHIPNKEREEQEQEGREEQTMEQEVLSNTETAYTFIIYGLYARSIAKHFRWILIITCFAMFNFLLIETNV